MDHETNKKSRLKVFLERRMFKIFLLGCKLGGDAITGIAFNMPLFFLVLGLTMGLGTGVTAAIARFIGEENKKQADNCAEHAVVMAVIISIILSSIGLLFGKEILSLFGAQGEILNLGWEYLHVMCVGMPFMIFS